MNKKFIKPLPQTLSPPIEYRSCASGGGGEENKNVKEVQLMKRNDLLIHAKLLKGSERFRGS